MYVTTHVSLRAKAQPNLIQTRGNIYPILQNLSPKSFPIVLNSNSIPLMIRIKISVISDFSSPPTASRPCRLYPEPSPAHHLHLTLWSKSLSSSAWITAAACGLVSASTHPHDRFQYSHHSSPVRDRSLFCFPSDSE